MSEDSNVYAAPTSKLLNSTQYVKDTQSYFNFFIFDNSEMYGSELSNNLLRDYFDCTSSVTPYTNQIGIWERHLNIYPGATFAKEVEL